MHEKIPSIIRMAAGVRVARLILHQPYFNEERCVGDGAVITAPVYVRDT